MTELGSSRIMIILKPFLSRIKKKRITTMAHSFLINSRFSKTGMDHPQTSHLIAQVLVAFVILLGSLSLAHAAGEEQNVFLDIGGGAIPGNATVSGYEDQIVVGSFSFLVSQAGEWEEGEQITGRVTTFGDLEIIKTMDNGSPSLAHASAMKTQYDTAELNIVVGADAFMTVTLEKVIVTNVGITFVQGDDRPHEVVTLSYRKATWRVGTATTSYDLAANA